MGQYFDGTFDRGFLLKGFPEHPSFFTIDGRNTNFPNTVVNAINDDEEVAGKLSNDGPDGTRNQVGFVAEPED